MQFCMTKSPNSFIIIYRQMKFSYSTKWTNSFNTPMFFLLRNRIMKALQNTSLHLSIYLPTYLFFYPLIYLSINKKKNPPFYYGEHEQFDILGAFEKKNNDIWTTQYVFTACNHQWGWKSTSYCKQC